MVRKGNREAIAGTGATALAFTGALLYRKARERAAAAELPRTALNWSCRYRTAGNGRRNTPDAYGSLATVRSTAASSRACKVCRA